MSQDLGSLEYDVDASRARFDRSLAELGRRLAVTGLADEALSFIGAKQAHVLRESLGDLVRRHPIPLLLVGSGIGLLLWEMRRQREEPDNAWYSTVLDTDGIADDEIESIVAVDVIGEFE